MAEDWLKATSSPLRPAQVDSSVPNVARVWNFLIGGRDNFEADRRAARQLLAAAPVMERAAPASRAFLRRSVAFLAEAGVRQFVDVGTGIPAAGNTHEVAQAVDPSCRVVYVDNDPVVLSHARARLRSAPEGATSCVDADARDTGAIVAGAAAILDLTQPVGVIMIDILNFLDDAAGTLGRLMAAFPAGSHVALMQPSSDERLATAAQRWNQSGVTPVYLRDAAEVAGWLTGLELVPPGIVEVHRWRPGPGDPPCPGGVPLLGVVARKPGPVSARPGGR